jgi:polar amino acid transport system substrate-binding protein
MNRYHYFFTVSLSLFFAGIAQAKQCDGLVITGHPAYPPVAWAANGKILGASTQLVTKIVNDLKVNKITSTDFGSWSKAQEAIRDGRADIIFGIYKNPSRAEYMHYIEPPYMLDPVSVVIRKGDIFKFVEWADLKGHRGVTNQGESYGSAFDAYIKSDLNVARSNGVDQAFNQLLNRQADYLLIGMYPGKLEAQKLQLDSKVVFLPKSVLTADMYIAFSKKSKCYAFLEKEFSSALRKAVASGVVSRLLDSANQQFYKSY